MFFLKWLWKNMQGYRGRYCLALCLTVVCQSMYILTPYFSQQIIDTFINNDNAQENLIKHTDLLVMMVAAMIGFTLIRTCIQYTSNMIYEHCSQRLIYRVRKKLYQNLNAQDASFFDYYRTGDLMTRMSGDIDMVRHSVAWIIKTILESVVLFGASAIYFFSIDTIMALCMIGLTPIIFIATFMFNRRVRPMYVDLREKMSALNTAAEENISGNRVVKAFTREDYEIRRFGEKNTEFCETNKKTALTWLKFFPTIEITAQALFVVQLLAGGIFVISGRISIGEFTAFAALIWTLANPMRTVGTIINDLQRFSASANKIIEIYYGKSKIADREDAVKSKGRVKGEVEFRNVSFKYGNKAVLHDINIDIKAGQTVAIMGETGSGKTTLVEMIGRIHDADEGSVCVDGVDVRMMKLGELRSSIGMATQDVLLFSDTVEGNIAFGNAELSEDEVRACAKSADADNFIARMTEGYDTIIGERGVGLSGGQKQRIALARALAVKPSILILDDTTSAVDLETERHIQESLKSLDFPCTKIIIAQRISSTKDADKIIVMKNGEIVDVGTHDELIHREGYYKEVYDLQH